MIRHAFRHWGSPAAKLFALSFAMAAFLMLPALLRGQAIGQITYMQRPCPGTGKAACFYCSTDPSTSSPGINGSFKSGCTDGSPPNWSFGQCDQAGRSEFDCNEKTMACGDYMTCAKPPSKIGTCSASNVICQNVGVAP